MAAGQRQKAIGEGRSFVAETLFSHPSKVDLVRRAKTAGYRVVLHVILVPEELAVQRVRARVDAGGHPVPEGKIRQRHRRLWTLVRQAIGLADRAEVLDNSRAARPFRRVASFEHGALVGSADWPPWTPADLIRS